MSTTTTAPAAVVPDPTWDRLDPERAALSGLPGLPATTLDQATADYSWPPAVGMRAGFAGDEGCTTVVTMPDGTAYEAPVEHLDGPVVVLADAGPDQELPADEVWHLMYVRDGEGRVFCAWSSELL